MSVFLLRLSSSSAFRKMLFIHFFDKTAIDYMISHITSYIFNYVEHPSFSKLLVIEWLTYFYNSKNSHLIVQPTCLKDKIKSSFSLFLLSTSFINTILHICHARLAIKCLASSEPVSPGCKSVPESISTNIFLKQLIESHIKLAEDQMLVHPRDTTNTLPKLWNPNLYYVCLYMKYYYFYW